MVFRFWRPIVSGWRRRPKSLACASFNPSRHTSKKGRSIWLWHPWGHDVQKWGYAAPGHLRQYAAALTMQWSVDRRGGPGHACQRTNLTIRLKLLEQGAKKSDGVSVVLGWSVSCHERLRSRCTFCPPSGGHCLLVFMLIALRAESAES